MRLTAPDRRCTMGRKMPSSHAAPRSPVAATPMITASQKGRFGPLDIVFVESGGDNLTATFSPALADTQIFVLDCAGGDDVPRKGGPGVERADLLVINKVDIAPLVGADIGKAKRAARLAKSDLLTEVVGEFPELQGLMGKYYALAQREDATVAAASEERRVGVHRGQLGAG